MDDDEQLRALELIIAEIDRLRILVSAPRYRAVSIWLDEVLAEARARLDEGRAARLGAADGSVRSDSPDVRAAQRHVADAEERVTRQRRIAERLSREGQNAAAAEAILATFADVLLVRRAMLAVAQDEAMGNRPWRPIATAPFNTAVELATIGPAGTDAVSFACRRELEGWVSVETGDPVKCDATHWRWWKGRAD